MASICKVKAILWRPVVAEAFVPLAGETLNARIKEADSLIREGKIPFNEFEFLPSSKVERFEIQGVELFELKQAQEISRQARNNVKMIKALLAEVKGESDGADDTGRKQKR